MKMIRRNSISTLLILVIQFSLCGCNCNPNKTEKKNEVVGPVSERKENNSKNKYAKIPFATARTDAELAALTLKGPLLIYSQVMFKEWDAYINWDHAELSGGYDPERYKVGVRKNYQQYKKSESDEFITEDFKVVLQTLGKLPKGSKVLGYPDYTWEVGGPLTQFYFDFRKLEDVVRERELVLVLSEFDHQGKHRKRNEVLLLKKEVECFMLKRPPEPASEGEEKSK
ncbi:MAG: hypothetical protein HY291_19095 [Planctomycetes bacterium]|nr:hypothetical protein [Planctomycetota bacterium]